jgi:hypothetical protein
LPAELITRFSPDDDTAFLSFALDRILGRRASDFERLPLEFDLRSGRVTRADVVCRLVARARAEGRHVVCDALTGPRTPPAGEDETAASLLRGIDAQGREFITLCEFDGIRGWRMAAHHLRQPVDIRDDTWRVTPGFVLAGPKLTLHAGRWMLSLDVIQSPEAVLALDVVANAGLDELAAIHLIGTFNGCGQKVMFN